MNLYQILADQGFRPIETSRIIADAQYKSGNSEFAHSIISKFAKQASNPVITETFTTYEVFRMNMGKLLRGDPQLTDSLLDMLGAGSPTAEKYTSGYMPSQFEIADAISKIHKAAGSHKIDAECLEALAEAVLVYGGKERVTTKQYLNAWVQATEIGVGVPKVTVGELKGVIEAYAQSGISREPHNLAIATRTIYKSVHKTGTGADYVVPLIQYFAQRNKKPVSNYVAAAITVASSRNYQLDELLEQLDSGIQIKPKSDLQVRAQQFISQSLARLRVGLF